MDTNIISASRSTTSSASRPTDSGDDDWLDVEKDEETISFVSLMDSQTFPNLSEMLLHCKQCHGFDLVATLSRLQLDFHGAVKLVNFIRNNVQKALPVPAEICALDFEDETYLKPVLDNDALIFSLDEVLEVDQDSKTRPTQQQDGLNHRELEAELEFVRNQFANYRLAVQETLDRRWGDDKQPSRSDTPSVVKDSSAHYFESYAAHEIHEVMLKDSVRTEAYRDFIYGNKHLFKDKVVLDIGCGTGILSMFCAKAGAARVLAVDKSDILAKATENIFNNGLSEKITCLKGAIEDVVLPVTQVDIIVSEWMGYCLLYEAMLPSVLYARDKYLKPGGLMAPSSVSLWIAPVADADFVSDNVAYWRDVYGFDMKAMQEGIYEEVRIEHMPQSSVCGEPVPFKMLDLSTVRPDELSFTSSWDTKLTRDIDGLDGFLIWFDNFFTTSSDEPCPEPQTLPKQWIQKNRGNVAFTTGPFGTATHWKQGLLIAPPAEENLKLTSAATVSGKISFSELEENARALMIKTSWSAGEQKERTWSWKLD